jgi:hypothetical protein
MMTRKEILEEIKDRLYKDIIYHEVGMEFVKGKSKTSPEMATGLEPQYAKLQNETQDLLDQKVIVERMLKDAK